MKDAPTSVKKTVSFSASAPVPPMPGAGMSVLHDPAWHLAALFAVAIALGGGGVGAGMANLVVQLAAILVMALHPRAFTHFFLRRPNGLTALVALSVLLVLVQLVPLPSVLWSALPGRDLVSASFARAGIDGASWFPLSLDRGRTLTSLMGTLLPVTVIVIGSVLPRERLNWLAGVVALQGVGAMIYGVMALLAPQDGVLNAAITPTVRRMGATFADWNAAALFFNSCLLMLIGVLQPRTKAPSNLTWLMLRAASAILLLVGIFLTQSRSGVALLAVPLALLVLLILRRQRPQGQGAEENVRPRRIFQPMLVLFVLAGMAIGLMAVSSSTRLSATFDRFATADDGKRAEMREDALTTAKHYWPIGAGMGSFDEVFQVDESLEYLSPHIAGRAHMDYYELAIEAGAPGLLLLACWVAWCFAATWQAYRQADLLALAGTCIIACCALQSIVSFPMRSQTILAVAAFAIVLLVRASSDQRRPS